MFGQNPILAPEHGDGAELKVHSIFETLQGEGPYVGHPAIFIRLAGCNLACNFCDTNFDDYEIWATDKLVTHIMNLSTDYKKLIVLTGGEPFRQPITKICTDLTERGFKVQIETNGTLYRTIPEAVTVVCSPKNAGNGYAMIREDLMPHVIAMKFLISAHDKRYNDIAEVGQKKFNVPVYVQPMDEMNESVNADNTLLAITRAEQHNVIFSLQVHKVLNIR